MTKIIQKMLCFLAIFCLLTGCKVDALDEISEPESSSEGSISLMDDTYYVADIAGILILCEENENLEYQENIQMLKGDKWSVEEAVKRLQGMEQTAAVKNAIGIGYIRLAQFEEAKKVLNQALLISEKDSDQACILNNLGNMRLISKEDFIQNCIGKRFAQALEKEMNPQNRLIIQMNQVCYSFFPYLDKKDPTGYAISEFERLLEEEKKLFGSNQIVGVYGYSMLSVFLASEESQDEDEVRCFNKALEINQKNHRYKAADINIYSGLARGYYCLMEYEKALECANKWIDLVEGFLSEEDDLMFVTGYYDKASILIKEKQYEEAIKCINALLDKEGIHIEKRAIAWFKLGEIYYEKGEQIKAKEAALKGYDIFKQYKNKNGYGEEEWKIEEIAEMYRHDNLDEGDPEYLLWLQEQLEKQAQK